MDLSNYLIKLIYIIVLYNNIYWYIIIKRKKFKINILFTYILSLFFIFLEYLFFSKYVIHFWSFIYYIISIIEVIIALNFIAWLKVIIVVKL